MSYTFNLDSTDATQKMIADVRDEIDDTTLAQAPVEGKDYFLSDERITRRLTDAAREGRSEVNVVKMAAASALDTLATNQAYVLKVGSTLGESRDGAAVAKSIRSHAENLRAQVKDDETPAAATPGTTRAKQRMSQSAPLRPTY